MRKGPICITEAFIMHAGNGLNDLTSSREVGFRDWLQELHCCAGVQERLTVSMAAVQNDAMSGWLDRRPCIHNMLDRLASKLLATRCAQLPQAVHYSSTHQTFVNR